MRTNRAIDNAHTRLTDWGEWCLSHLEQSSIGYPSRTQETANIRSGWVGAICPDVMKPPRVASVDAIIRRMPDYVRIAIYCKYYPEGAEDLANIQVRHSKHWAEGDKMRLFKTITGLQVNDYYACWREGQAWIASGVG